MRSAKERFLQLIPRLSEAQAQAALDAVAELERAKTPQERKVAVVVALTQTCLAVPSQWEGELDNGRSLYVRYRHGLLRVGVGEGLSEAIKNSAPETALHCERLGDQHDGVMSSEELHERLRGVLEFADGLVVEEDPEWSSTPSAGDDG
jgi:hypothetical protein